MNKKDELSIVTTDNNNTSNNKKRKFKYLKKIFTKSSNIFSPNTTNIKNLLSFKKTKYMEEYFIDIDNYNSTFHNNINDNPTINNILEYNSSINNNNTININNDNTNNPTLSDNIYIKSNKNNNIYDQKYIQSDDNIYQYENNINISDNSNIHDHIYNNKFNIHDPIYIISDKNDIKSNKENLNSDKNYIKYDHIDNNNINIDSNHNIFIMDINFNNIDNNNKKLLPEDTDWEYKDNEISCIQDIDDLVNPNPDLIYTPNNERYYPNKKDDLKLFIKNNYLNGNIILQRKNINITKWVNYDLDDYDDDDIQLFRKIDKKNYIYRTTKNKTYLNNNYNYEFMIIKNYKKFFEELYNDYNNDKEILYKYPKIISKITSTENINPDKDIYIKIDINNLNKNDNNEIEENSDNMDIESNMDIDSEDNIDNKKLYKKNIISYKKNKIYKKKNIVNIKNNSDKIKDNIDKKKVNFNKKKDNIDKKKDNIDKEYNENNIISDNIINEDKIKEEKKLNKEGYYNIDNIYNNNGFNQQHRINIYNTFKIYTSRILDIIFYKTGWNNLFVKGKKLRKEIPMICLPCMKFYVPNTFRKHIIEFHNKDIEKLYRTMKKYAYTKYNKKGEILNRTKNVHYIDVYRKWKINEIKNREKNKINEDENKVLLTYDIKENNISNKKNNNSDKDNNKDNEDNIMNLFKKKNMIKYENINDLERIFLSKKKRADSILKLGNDFYDYRLKDDNIYFELIYEIFYNNYNVNQIIKLYKYIEEKENKNNFINQYNNFIENIKISTLSDSIKVLRLMCVYEKEDIMNKLNEIINRLLRIKIDIIGVRHCNNNEKKDKNNKDVMEIETVSDKKNKEYIENNNKSDKKNKD